jgi:peptidoglycan hydrolase-like protein with peptidoglycan-binding domain
MRTLLDVITDEEDGSFNKGSPSDEIEQGSVGSISATDYIKWVQRSLNRLYGSHVHTDGKLSSAYRAAVRKFNREYLWRDYDDVDEQTQNQLVLVNERNRDYVQWLIRALNQVGRGPLPFTETYTSAVRNAIKTFQRRVGLRVDGCVGSKTELALIKATGTCPPGHFGSKPLPRERATFAFLPDRVFQLKSFGYANHTLSEAHMADIRNLIAPLIMENQEGILKVEVIGFSSGTRHHFFHAEQRAINARNALVQVLRDEFLAPAWVLTKIELAPMHRPLPVARSSDSDPEHRKVAFRIMFKGAP